MKRRELVWGMPLLLASGCAKRVQAPVAAAAAGTAAAWPGRLVKPLVSEERITRVTVGLRPYRPQGFRVEREAMQGKTVIHNYGHGGGGMTLSWGSAERAVGLLEGGEAASVAVMGCGVMGLSTARLLQQRGIGVTIYTKAMPPETTSNWSGAQWWPTSVHDGAAVDEAYKQGFYQTVKRAYRLMQNYVGAQYGVDWRANYFVSENPMRENELASAQGPIVETQPEFREAGPGQHSLPWKYVRSFQSMMIEPNHYLRALLADFYAAGGKVVRREIRTLAELEEKIVFNCLGLGAREVFGDRSLAPIRGQLVVLLPQAGLNYNLLGPGVLYLFPRKDGVLLGGSYDKGEESLTPDPEITKRILAGHQALIAGL